MQTHSSDVDVASVSDTLGLETWNIERTSEQLLEFVNLRHAALEHIEI